MTTSTFNQTDKEDKPLTRAEVERFLHELSSSDELDLHGQNLNEVDLSHLDLTGAELSGVQMRFADLSGTNLTGANLSQASLNGANLHNANLRRANLTKANLALTNLSSANFTKAVLSGANLSDAILRRTDFSEADLSGATLNRAELSETNLTDANLFKANSHGINWLMTEDDKKQLLRLRGAIGLDEPSFEGRTIFRIRIIEEPLTAQNLTMIISALTELSTKYWLIAKSRFADLIEYTQTHNGRFAEEAQIVVTRISYNSPFNMDWKVDLSAPSVAEALITTIDGITQRQERLEKAKLENQTKALEIKEAEQEAEQGNQMALLEQEKQRLELEQRRLEVLEKQLEVQKKSIEYALEIAGKVVDTLHPGADPATRAMEIQALLPNLVQLQNGKGLELALPPLSKDTE